MRILVDLVVLLVKALFHAVWGAIKALLPRCSVKPPDFSNDICLVTGAGQGLGRLLALKYAECGATMVLWDINREQVDSVADEIREMGNEVFPYVCDVSKREEVYRIADQVREEVGDVAILVNNAGVLTGKRLMEAADESLERTFKVNTLAHYWTVKAFLPWMLENNYGYIVSIASVMAFGGVSHLTDYCASKSAAFTFAEALRSELLAAKKTGISITCLCPYHIHNTAMFNGIRLRLPFLFPSLSTRDVVERTIQAMVERQFVVIMPRILYVFNFLKCLLPTKATDCLLTLSGANTAMEGFSPQQHSKRD